MQAKSPPRMQIVKREEKEGKLGSFIIEYLDHLSREQGGPGDHPFLVVALSTQSPVVCALKRAANLRDLSRRRIQLILASVNGADLLTDLSDLPTISVSWARNARLLDAHEQLVMSETTCWTGDCMRREPTKRDAFECFADDCAETAGWAITSFERLWAASVPMFSTNGPEELEIAPDILPSAGTIQSASATIVGTRH